MDFNEFVNRGTTFAQEGKFGPAIENFKAALEFQPGNTEIPQIIEMLEQQASLASGAARASADEAKSRAEVMRTLWGITDVDKAIPEYTEALKRNPNDATAKSILASAYYIRGLTFTSKGEFARAIEDYSEAIKYEPDYPLAFNKRGWANLEIENYDEAIKDFKKLIEFRPNDAEPKQNLANAYSSRAIAYDKKGDYAHAIPDFEMVLTFKPDDSTTRELLEMAKAAMAKKLTIPNSVTTKETAVVLNAEEEAKKKAAAAAERAAMEVAAEVLKAEEEAKKKAEAAVAATAAAAAEAAAEVLKAEEEAKEKAEAAVAAVAAAAEAEAAEAAKIEQAKRDALSELPKILPQIKTINSTANLNIADAEQLHQKAGNILNTLTEYQFECQADFNTLKTGTGNLLLNIQKAKQKIIGNNLRREKLKRIAKPAKIIVFTLIYFAIFGAIAYGLFAARLTISAISLPLFAVVFGIIGLIAGILGDGTGCLTAIIGVIIGLLLGLLAGKLFGALFSSEGGAVLVITILLIPVGFLYKFLLEAWFLN
jgi:Tfp pilus assembly protein PilF